MNEIQLYNKLSNDVDTCTLYCESIQKDSNLCNVCWKYKQYTNFECRFFEPKKKYNPDFNVPQCSKKCVTCLCLINSNCPLLGEDYNLVKRLFVSFKIKLHIPTESRLYKPCLPETSIGLIESGSDII